MTTTLVRAIEKHGLHEQAIVSSFSPIVSYRVKRADPKIFTGYGISTRDLIDGRRHHIPPLVRVDEE